MNRLIELTNQWSSLLVEQAWTILWQSTLLVAVVALLMQLLRKASPTLRFWLWQVVAIKLLLLPLWKVDAPQPAWLAKGKTEPPAIASNDIVRDSSPSPKIETTVLAEPTPAVSPAPTPPSPADPPTIAWQSWLIVLWLAGSCYQVAQLIFQRQQLQKLLRNARPLPHLSTEVEQCAVALGLSRSPTVLMVQEELSPFVCGLRSPRLILPQSLSSTAHPKRLRQIILHELAHIRRRDLLWCWLPSVVQIIYWFHPAPRWVTRQLQLERELACDQIAMQTSGSTAGEYAHTLVDVVSHTASQVAARAAFTAQFAGGTK